MVLKELLEEEKFHYLRLLNTDCDLFRTVMTVESTETPDVAGYIPPNTLLLMTGMAFQDSQEKLCGFLRDLDKRSCAGVAIKLGRFIDRLEERVLETADSLRLPLIQIPLKSTLGEVYHEVLSYIWNNQNDNLLNALNTQKKISNLILQGSSLKSIMNNMTAILNRPVMVVDLFGTILDYGYTFSKGEREAALSVLEKYMDQEKPESGSLSLWQEEGKNYCIYPIKGVGRSTNFMVIPDFDPMAQEDTLLVMEQVMMALEMYFYRDLYVRYNNMKAQGEFLSILLDQLSDKTWSERQVLSIGESHGLREAPAYQIVLASVETTAKRKFNASNFSRREERFVLIYSWIQQVLLRAGEKNILIFPQEEKWRYVLLLQGKNRNLREEYIQIHDYIEKKFSISVTIAQGGIVSSLLNLKNSYQEAEKCMEDGNQDGQLPYLLSYKPRNMLELFEFVPEREMEEICLSTLKELTFPKNQMQEELRKTLQTYLSCGNSVTKTAEDMFLHRNTIKYRIKKCEEILGTGLSSVSDCFHIQLALVLSERLKKTE